MPTRSDVFPLLSKFYGCCIFILTCALLCTCWVVAYYFHDMSGWKIYSMPKFVQVGVLHYLGRLLRLPNVRKVFPSVMLDSVDNQKKIDVKPVGDEQTNFTGVSAVTNPNVENERVKEDKKRSDIERNESKSENNDPVDETQNKKDKEKNDIAVNVNNTAENKNQEKVKDKKRSRKEPKDLNDAKENGIKSAKPESMEIGAMKKKAKDTIDNEQASDVVAPSDTQRKMSNDKTVSSNIGNDVIVENKESSRSDSKGINHSEPSKKTNRAFASTVSPGLIETAKKPRRRKKVIKETGVVNQATGNEDAVPGNKDEAKECDGKTGEKESVRESPSLENKTEEISDALLKNGDGDNVDGFDGKTTIDFGFDVKEHKKKRHESVKWLRELAEHYADRSQRKKNRYQWRQAANILNRLFFIILFISIVISIIAVFLAR